MTLPALPAPAVSGFVKDRRVRYDSCGLCDLPRSDRHHRDGYRMYRTPYDIPGHAFVDPASLAVLPVLTRPAVDPCRHGHCVLTRWHGGDHLDHHGRSFGHAR